MRTKPHRGLFRGYVYILPQRQIVSSGGIHNAAEVKIEAFLFIQLTTHDSRASRKTCRKKFHFSESNLAFTKLKSIYLRL